MKKIFVLTALHLFSCSVLFCQLSGQAFLAGQNNHSAIKVKFISTGGTAVTDSAYSNTAGSYSINITGGMYQVLLSKNGYLDHHYNNGSAVLMTNTTTLNSVTLQPGNGVNVSGAVSGTWTSNNTYIVTGDIHVPSGQDLTIQPGTSVRFNGAYNFTVAGKVTASGTSANPILFTSNLSSPSAGNWKAISVQANGSVFNHCIIEYCQMGLDILNCSPVVTNNEIRHFSDYGIRANGSASTISENRIHDFFTNDLAQGIMYYNSNTIHVQCNQINDGAGYGIRPLSGGLVTNNVIYNIKSVSRGYAMGCGTGCTARIENNFMHDCNAAFWIDANVLPEPHPEIINNTMVNMTSQGIMMSGMHADADIINNIFYKCETGIKQSVPQMCGNCSTTPSKVENNILWDNFTADFSGVQISNLGTAVSTNAQNNPVDAYFNMSLDPKFTGNLPPVLDNSSPAIGAGKTGYSANIGYDKSIACDALVIGMETFITSKAAVNVFPNPFTTELTISVQDEITRTMYIEITEAQSGKVVKTQSIIQEGDTKINTTALSSGLYIVRLKGGSAGDTYLKAIRVN